MDQWIENMQKDQTWYFLDPQRRQYQDSLFKLVAEYLQCQIKLIPFTQEDKEFMVGTPANIDKPTYFILYSYVPYQCDLFQSIRPTTM